MLPDFETMLEISAILRAVILSTNFAQPPLFFLAAMATFLSGSWTAFQKQVYRFQQLDRRGREFQDTPKLHEQLHTIVDRLQDVGPDEMPTYSDCSFLDGDGVQNCPYTGVTGPDIGGYNRVVVHWVYQIVRVCSYLNPSFLAPLEVLCIVNEKRSSLDPFDRNCDDNGSHLRDAFNNKSEYSEKESAILNARLGDNDKTPRSLISDVRGSQWNKDRPPIPRLSMVDIAQGIAIDFGDIKLLETLKWSPQSLNTYSNETSNNSSRAEFEMRSGLEENTNILSHQPFHSLSS